MGPVGWGFSIVAGPLSCRAHQALGSMPVRESGTGGGELVCHIQMEGRGDSAFMADLAHPQLQQPVPSDLTFTAGWDPFQVPLCVASAQSSRALQLKH